MGEQIHSDGTENRSKLEKMIDDCNALRAKNIEGQEKMVIAISSALFGLLLAIFDKDLLDKSQISSYLFCVLILSNAVALIFALFSFYTGNKALDRVADSAKASYNDTNKQPETENCWEHITEILNKISLFATCVTVAMLAIIVWQIF